MRFNTPESNKTADRLLKEYGGYQNIKDASDLIDGTYVVKTQPNPQEEAKKHYLEGLATLNKNKERRALKEKINDAFSDLDNGIVLSIDRIRPLKNVVSPDWLEEIDCILELLGEAEKAYKEIAIYTDKLEKELKKMTKEEAIEQVIKEAKEKGENMEDVDIEWRAAFLIALSRFR